MKDRVILLSTLTLLVTVALFAWFTWAHWGTVGIYPALGWLVLGATFFALSVASLFLLSRRRIARAHQHPTTIASQPPLPAESRQEAAEKAKVTTVEIS